MCNALTSTYICLNYVFFRFGAALLTENILWKVNVEAQPFIYYNRLLLSFTFSFLH